MPSKPMLNFQLSPASRLIIAFLALQLSPCFSAPLITEFMASNDTTHQDGNGEFSDWIEIHNPDTIEVNLAGYRLTDDASDGTKWTFPSNTLLPAGEFLVVFASGDNTPDLEGNLHTNFKLSTSGEYLALLSPSGTLLSEFDANGTNYAPQETDVSWGLAFATPIEPMSVELMGSSVGNGSFEDQTGGVGVGSPDRFGANTANPIATIPGWTASVTSGFAGFDNDKSTFEGAWYGFANDDVVAEFTSDPIATPLEEGQILSLTFEATTNATNGSADFLVELLFDSGGDVSFAPLTYVTEIADSFDPQTFTHTITASQAGANEVTVKITLDNNTGGPEDQPRFDDLELTLRDFPLEVPIEAGDDARLLVPGNDDSVDSVWFQNGFDDSSWAIEPTPIGYENSSGGSVNYVALLADGFSVPSGTTTAYLRQTFNITDRTQVSDLLLELQYDDGFIAYINGERVEEQNAPGIAEHDSIAEDDHPDATAVNFTPFSLNNGIPFLVDGQNVLAIHALNRFSSSNDFLINPRLTVELNGATQGPTIRVPNVIGSLLDATPGQPNSEVRAGGVIFSAPSGLFTTNFDLTLTSEDVGDEIRYTTNGSIPNMGSTLYAGMISITGTAEIRARTFSTSGGVGAIAGGTFTKLENALINWSSNLPVIVLENQGQGNPLDRTYRDSFTTVFEPDAVSGSTTLTSVPTLTERSAWHRRGSSSFTFGKPNYRLEFRDQNDEDKAVPLLDLPSESDWVLGTFARFDRAMVRDPFAMETSSQTGNYAPRTRYVEVFFNQDGDDLEESDYFGVYYLIENIKRDSDRIDITKLEATDNTGEDVTGGYIIKSDRTASGDYTFQTSRGIPSDGGGNFVSVEPEGPDLSPQQKSYISGYFQDFEDALYGTNFENNGIGYEEYIDVDSFVDQHIFQLFNKNPDALRFSTYFHKDRGGKLVMGPIWDQERIMGVESDTSTNRARNPEEWNGDGSVADLFHYDWWDRLFQDPDFMQRWIDRWELHRDTAYNQSNLTSLFDSYQEQLLGPNSLASPVTRNFVQWGDTASNNNNEAWPNNRIATSTNPSSNDFYQFADPAITSGFTDPASNPAPANILAYWSAEMDHVRNWASMRLAWIGDNLPALAEFSVSPGQVSSGTNVSIIPPANISAGATIWFTTDGTDPRASGGAPSASAQQWQGTPIPINSSQRITVRVLDPADENPANQVLGQVNSYDVWSAPRTGLFEVGATVANSLVISEIHYNPHDPSVDEEAAIPGGDNDDFEFVELMNIHPTQSINLSGAQLTEAITFTFGNITLMPGERVLVVENIPAFEERYGTGLNVVGKWSGGLSNSGETLRLLDDSGNEIQAVSYKDSGLWDSGADGDGRSLILKSPGNTLRQRLNKSYSWTGSSAYGGTPGTPDLYAATITNVVINEVLAHTDLPQKDSIELYNPSDSPIDISGWFLSDSGSKPLKFEIPANTTLPAGGYLVFDEDDFNPNPMNPGANDFALNSTEGDDVYLVIPDGNQGVLTYVDHFEFGASFNGQSIGLWPNGSGRPTTMKAPTLGAANGAPSQGPVIISEVNYNPGLPSPAALMVYPLLTPDDLEFIEIHNTTSSTVSLTDWRLRGEGDFDFAASTSLAAGASLVVIGFDPVDPANSDRLDAFRIHYGISSAVPLFGGFLGKLDDSEGRIALQRPDDPPLDNPTFTPHIIEDELVYDDLSPWPLTADGGGLSLTRTCSFCFTSIASAWAAQGPTPGSAAFPDDNLMLTLSIAASTNPDEALLTFPSLPGLTYTLETGTDLENWASLLEVVAQPGTSTSLPVATVDDVRFYRVRYDP